MKENPDTAAIYHELSRQYGQTMTMDDVKKEMQYKKAETIKRYFPDGWISGRGGLRIKTISFARQLAELNQ